MPSKYPATCFRLSPEELALMDELSRRWTVATPPSRTEVLRIAIRAAMRETEPKKSSRKSREIA